MTTVVEIEKTCEEHPESSTGKKANASPENEIVFEIPRGHMKSHTLAEAKLLENTKGVERKRATKSADVENDTRSVNPDPQHL